MAKSIIDKGLINCEEFWGTEVSLYFPKIYAGTTDLIGVHQGSPAIMDHKQTNKLKKREWIDDYFSQLVFYGTAHNEVYQTNIKKGVIFMCTADNVYQEFILEGGEWEIYESKMWDRIEKYYKQFL
jgi:genome maintenance exonuclease 1